MTVRVSFDDLTRRFLRTTGECYPYAYGYLVAQIRGYLDGDISRERMEAVLDALDAELRGDRR
jgi:hypothetical protein